MDSADVQVFDSVVTSLEKPTCSNIVYTPLCNVLYTKGWCYWDYEANVCKSNYDDGMFVPTLDPMTSKSIIFVIYVAILYFLYNICSFIVDNVSLFNKLNTQELVKDIIYHYILILKRILIHIQIYIVFFVFQNAWIECTKNVPILCRTI